MGPTCADNLPLPAPLPLQEIDLGEDKPRQVISGLVKFVPQEAMQVGAPRAQHTPTPRSRLSMRARAVWGSPVGACMGARVAGAVVATAVGQPQVPLLTGRCTPGGLVALQLRPTVKRPLRLCSPHITWCLAPACP